MNTSINCVERFYTIYHNEPKAIGFCPYRICPIGAHVDHQFGKITGIALDKGIHLAYRPTSNGIIDLASLQFEKRVQFRIDAIPPRKQNDWADYLRGVTLQLLQKYPLTIGMEGVFQGSIPIGGLSSSAAVSISFLMALCDVNGIHLSPSEIIQFSQHAENQYVGVSSGKLDQCCEVYCQAKHLLYLDTLDDSFELIPEAPSMPPYKILIFFSGLEHALSSSPYNIRVEETRATAYALRAFAGMPYGRIADAALREIPPECFETYKEKLPRPWRKRAEHFFSEQQRVQAGVEAWRKGDLAAFGKCSFESGLSTLNQWETGSPELKALFEALLHTDGIYGGRISGAGFKGCCMAFVDPSCEDSITQKVTAQYLAQFPEMKEKFAVFSCENGDGILKGGF